MFNTRARLMRSALAAMAAGTLAASFQSVPAYAGTTGTRNMAGVAVQICNSSSLSTTQVTLTVLKHGNSLTVTFSPSTVPVFCNAASGGTLTVTAQRLNNGGNPQGEYRLSVVGWGTPDVTCKSISASCTVTRTKTTPTSAPLTFLAREIDKLSSKTEYTATIQLSLSNP